MRHTIFIFIFHVCIRFIPTFRKVIANYFYIRNPVVIIIKYLSDSTFTANKMSSFFRNATILPFCATE